MARGEGRRVHHTKSRFGCQQCKTRKVKCDEVRPKCNHCVRYSMVCEYARRPRASNSSVAPPSSASEEPLQQSVMPSLQHLTTHESGLSRSKDTILELQLMHHYTSVTSQHNFLVSHDPDVKDLYIRVAPTLALKHECLMNALFAASALHMYKKEPERTEFCDIHRKYFDAAVMNQHQAVNDINAENAEALCLTAAFITFQALTMRAESTKYSPPSVWLDLHAGNATLFRSAGPWLREGKQILSIVKAEPNFQYFRAMYLQEYPDMFPDDPEAMFPSLLEFDDPAEKLDHDRLRTYKWCMGFVCLTLRWIESGEEPSKIRRLQQSLGATAPALFNTLVRERQPRALVILAHFFAIMKAVDDVWWIRGVPEREVFGIQGLLPDRWQWAMAWPIQKISFYAAAAIPPRDSHPVVQA